MKRLSAEALRRQALRCPTVKTGGTRRPDVENLMDYHELKSLKQ